MPYKDKEKQKAYQTLSAKKRRTQLKLKVLEYLESHPCVDCGEKDPIVLDFDHLGDKISDISRMINGIKSWELIEAEIKKCQVRCANCHRRKTYEQLGYWRLII